MLPKSLSQRIFLAFAGLSVAMLVTVSASLFVVLRDAHRDSITQSLGHEVVAIEADLLADQITEQAQIEQKVKNLIASIVDDGGFVLVQGPRGAIRIVAGSPSSTPVPSPVATGVKNPTGTLSTSDGRQFVYVEPNPNGTGGLKFVFAVPDTSAQQALGDLDRQLVAPVKPENILQSVCNYFGLAPHLRAVSDAGLDVPGFQAGIVLQNFAFGRAGSQQIQNQRNPNAMAANAGLAEAAFRINPDALEQFFAGKLFMCFGFHRSVRLSIS